MDSEFSFQSLSHSQQENTAGKEMAEKKKNTMSMKLAIQRELAYRRKLEEFQSQPQIDSADQIMAMQQQVQFPRQNPSRPNPNSSPRLSGKEHVASLTSPEWLPSPRPRKYPSSRPNSCSGPMISEREQLASSSKSPTQQLQLFNSNLSYQSLHFFCEVCQVPCSGSLNYKLHINGKKHKAKLQELKFGGIEGGDTCAMANQTSCCKLCNIWCTDDNMLKQHLAGQKHEKMQQKLERATTVEGGIVREQNWCALCGIGCSSKELLHLHFDGRKHQDKKRKLECAPKGGEEAQNQGKRCKLCNTWYANKNSLLIHLREEKHFLNELEVKKRQLQDLIRDEGNS